MILMMTSAVKMMVNNTFSWDKHIRMLGLNAGYLSMPKHTVFSTMTSMIEPSNRG